MLNIGGSIADIFFNYCSSENSLESRSSGQDPTHMMEALKQIRNDEFVPYGGNAMQTSRQNFGQILYGVSSPNIVNTLVSGNAALAGAGIINFVLSLGINNVSGKALHY